MSKILTFKKPEMITSKGDRLKLEEIKVKVSEICAIHHSSDGKYILAIYIRRVDKSTAPEIPACIAFHISQEDYEMAKPIFSSKK